MPYKISGILDATTRLIIINQSDWSIESNTEETSDSYEIDALTSGNKLIVGMAPGGEAIAYGYVDPISYDSLLSGDRGWR